MGKKCNSLALNTQVSLTDPHLGQCYTSSSTCAWWMKKLTGNADRQVLLSTTAHGRQCASVGMNIAVLQEQVIPRALKWGPKQWSNFRATKRYRFTLTKPKLGFQSRPKHCKWKRRWWRSWVHKARLLAVIFDGQPKFAQQLARASRHGWKSVQSTLPTQC